MKPFIIICQSPPEPHMLYRCVHIPTRKTVGRDANYLIDKEIQPLTIIHIVHNIIGS